MSKIFICDNCFRQFPQPLDEETYKDEHGEWHVFDLCAPCRKLKLDAETVNKKDYFDKLAKAQKPGPIK
jgi:hypothetical protein